MNMRAVGKPVPQETSRACRAGAYCRIRRSRSVDAALKQFARFRDGEDQEELTRPASPSFAVAQ